MTYLVLESHLLYLQKVLTVKSLTTPTKSDTDILKTTQTPLFTTPPHNLAPRSTPNFYQDQLLLLPHKNNLNTHFSTNTIVTYSHGHKLLIYTNSERFFRTHHISKKNLSVLFFRQLYPTVKTQSYHYNLVIYISTK